MKKRIFQTIIIIFLLISASSFHDNFRYSRVYINEDFLKAEIASTDRQRREGLSGRENIAEDEALILEFDKEGYHPIWMKDMNFSIDVIWLNSNKEIVDFKKNLSPDSYPQTFTPQRRAKYVLEVKSGFIEREDLNIGDVLEF